MHILLLLLPLMAILIIRIIINSPAAGSDEQKTEDYLARERKAMFARNIDISNLEMFVPALEKLPFHNQTDDNTLSDIENNVKSSGSEPMLDLHGYSNTDLKLMYGNGNFPTISKYDQNFMYFTRDMFIWGKYLYENNYIADACTVLEYLISIATDNSSAFTILAKIYCSYNKPEKISELINIVEETPDSLSKKSTLNSLRNIINSY